MAGADRGEGELLTAPGRVLFFFVDGVGLGPPAETNPFTAARLPTLERILGGRRPFADSVPGSDSDAGGHETRDPDSDPHPGAASRPRRTVLHGPEASLVALDASHGVDGIPQSGTGHTTLLTGVDAVARFGRHYGPWVPTALRPLVAKESILARAKRAGLRVAFANAYPEELMERVPADVPVAEAVTSRRLGPLRSGPPLAALGAGLLTHHTAALAAGRALASEITNRGWIERLHRTELPDITAEDAGRNLARIVAGHDLTLFAYYTTDYVGHRGTWDEAVEALERFDACLSGLLDELPDDALVIVASDHGNIEDATTEHTRNHALGLVVGLGREQVAEGLRDLWDVPAAILNALRVD